MPNGRGRSTLLPTHSLDRGKQLGNAPLHEFSHHQRCPGAFDTVDVEDLPCDPIQIVGVTGDHVHDEVVVDR